jgi:cysteine synthase B
MSIISPCEVPATLNGHAPPPIEQLGRDSVNILGYVGNTPLLCLGNLTRHLTKVKVYAKAEYLNPAAALKIARPQHGAARRSQRRTDARQNHSRFDQRQYGHRYAMIGAARGYKVKLVMPGNVSPERKAIVQLYGAKSCCPANMKAATARFCSARQIYSENPDAYFKPDQYNNEMNPLAHYRGTGRKSGGRRTGASRTFWRLSAPAAR